MDGIIAHEFQEEPVYRIKKQREKEYLPVIFLVSIKISEQKENYQPRDRGIYLSWLFNAKYLDPITTAIKKTADPADGISEHCPRR
jgi:hypothetical protein